LRKSKDEPKDLYQGLTGVRREYRGKGVAMALKLKTIEYAQRHGYAVIKTWNESNNVGMLAINEKLGFVRQPAWVTFAKEFS
jgi:GNAT superfamily N-acetyltransferase